MRTFCFSLLIELDLIVVVSFCYNLLSLFLISMVRTKTTPKKEREGRIVLRSSEEQGLASQGSMRQEGERSGQGGAGGWLDRWGKRRQRKRDPPLLSTTPPQPKGPHPCEGGGADALDEMVKQVEEAGQLEEVGWSLSSLLTRQLAQMAAEDWAICLRGAACPKEALPYCQGQGPTERVPEGRAGKEAQEVLAWHSCPSRDLAVSEEHWTLNLEAPLLTASPWDSPSSGQKRPVLPGEHHHMPAGGCRGIFGVSFGRRQPMCHSCKKGNYYAQRRSVGPPHPRRASISLKSSSKQANLLLVGCVGFFSFVCV